MRMRRACLDAEMVVRFERCKDRPVTGLAPIATVASAAISQLKLPNTADGAPNL